MRTRIHTQSSFLLVVAIALVAIPTFAVETIIFDSFGTNDPPYSDTAGIFVHWDNDYLDFGQGDSDQDAAMAFTAIGSGFESYGIELGLSLDFGDNELDISLLTDAANSPGTVLATWHVTGALGSYPGVYPPVVVSGDTFTLVDGDLYWVVVSASGPADSQIVWHTNTSGYVGMGAGRHEFWGDPATWTTNNLSAMTMRITGHTRTVTAENQSWGAVKSLYK